MWLTNNGKLEFHKSIYNNDIKISDEIIGYSEILRNDLGNYFYGKLENYKITSDDSNNLIKFYAKYINSMEYNDALSTESQLITFVEKSTSYIQNKTWIDNNRYYKFGDNIDLLYSVSKTIQDSQSNDIAENNYNMTQGQLGHVNWLISNKNNEINNETNNNNNLKSSLESSKNNSVNHINQIENLKQLINNKYSTFNTELSNYLILANSIDYNSAISSLEQIISSKDTIIDDTNTLITQNTSEKLQLQSEIDSSTSSKITKQTELDSKQSELTSKMSLKDSKQSTYNNNLLTIQSKSELKLQKEEELAQLESANSSNGSPDYDREQILLTEIQTLANEISELESQNTILQNEINQLSIQISNLEILITNLIADISNLENIISTNTPLVSQLTSEISTLETTINEAIEIRNDSTELKTNINNANYSVTKYQELVSRFDNVYSNPSNNYILNLRNQQLGLITLEQLTTIINTAKSNYSSDLITKNNLESLVSSHTSILNQTNLSESSTQIDKEIAQDNLNITNKLYEFITLTLISVDLEIQVTTSDNRIITLNSELGVLQTSRTTYENNLVSYRTTMETTAISEGIVEFHIKYTGSNSQLIDEIIGTSTLDFKGDARLFYRLNNLSNMAFYGIFKNSNNYEDKISDDVSISVNNKFPATITDNNVLLESYKIGSEINLIYSVKHSIYNFPITEGTVELHKVINNTQIDQIVGYVDLSKPVNNAPSNGNALFKHIVSDSVNFGFYAKFTNSMNFNDDITTTKYTNGIIKYNMNIDDSNINLDSSYKLGQFVTLTYGLTYNSQAIEEGTLEIHKKHYDSNNLEVDEIIHIAKSTDFNNGIVTFEYKLVDINNIGFYVVYNNSNNYNDKITEPKYTTVYKQKDSIIVPNVSLNNSYKIGDIKTLSFKVTDLLGNSLTQGDVEFHKVISNRNIDIILGYVNLTTENNGVAQLDYKFIDNGEVRFYAIYKNSIDYQEKESTQISTNVIKQFTNITLVEHFTLNNQYKLWSNIPIKYQAKNSITNENIKEGSIILHKVIKDTNINEIIEVVNLSNNNFGIITFNYTVIDTNDIGFYAVFDNSINYVDVTTQTRYTKGFKQHSVNVTDNNSLLPNTKKLNENIQLNYTISNPENININEGKLEIHKVIPDTGIDIIVDYLHINSSGTVGYTYRLVDTGSIYFYAVFDNSINFARQQSSNTKTITVFKQYEVNIIDSSVLSNQYKLSDEITLKYRIRRSDNNEPVNQGYIEYHKLTVDTNIDEIIGYSDLSNVQNDSDGQFVSFVHKLTNVGQVKFYASFERAIDFNNKTSDYTSIINVRQKNNSLITISTLQNDIKYGDFITINANIVSGNSIINEGIVELYRQIAIDQNELVATSGFISNNNTSLSYRINSISNVKLFAVFKNSINYNNSTSDILTIGSGKRNTPSINLTTSGNNYYLDFTTVVATISFDSDDNSDLQGTVTFNVLNNNVTTSYNIDVNNKVAKLKLLLAKNSNYNITATYNGNNVFNSITSSTLTIQPQINNSDEYNLKFQNAYVNVGTESDFVFGNQFTIEAWIKTTNFSGELQGVLVKDKYFGLFTKLGKLYFYNWITNTETDSGITINDGEWHHVAVVYNFNNIELYVDGSRTLFNGLPFLNNPIDSSKSSYSSFKIGIASHVIVKDENDVILSNSFNGFFNGYIKNVRVWNNYRNEFEINQNMNTTINPETNPNLITYLPINDGLTTTINNTVNSSLNGTLVRIWEWAGLNDFWISSKFHRLISAYSQFLNNGHSRIVADMILNDYSIQNSYILRNTGYIVFKQMKNNDVIYTDILPIQNGTVYTNMKVDFNSGFKVAVTYQDTIENPSYVIEGPTVQF
jgi:hypothetical protein